MAKRRKKGAWGSPAQAHRKERGSLPSLATMCAMGEDDLSRTDIAVFNLLCATGLPGAEKLHVRRLLDWLDDAADRVSLETRRHWYRFIQSPATYQNSPGYYCCYFLLQTLQEDFGVKYNAARAADPSFQDPRRLPDFRDSRDVFIHGIIDGHGGTCGSMPVIYVAVGRRLGYPLKLVEARAHLFIRWDDPLGTRFGVPELFNIEGAGYGMASYPDSYYETWPEPWTPAERAAGCYLKSLSPREELAAFLATRAHCLIDNRRPADAIQAFRWACALVPHDQRHRNELDRLMRWFFPSPQQIYERQMAIARQKQWLEQQLAPRGGPPPLPPEMTQHPAQCPCADCDRLRKAQRRRPMGHSPHCGCLQCEPPDVPPLKPVNLGHTPNCPCPSCLRARESQRTQARPFGHSPHCGCLSCQQTTRTLRSYGPAVPGTSAYPFLP